MAFALAALAGGFWLGGAFALGRSDAALAVPTLLGFAFVYTGVAERAGHQRTALTGGAGLVAALLLLTAAGLVVPGWREGLWSLPQSLAYLVATGCALAIAALGVRRTAGLARVWRWTLAVVLALLWWFAAHVGLGRAYLPTPPAEAGRTILVTGLPLVQWARPGQAVDVGDDPALTALRAMSARPITLVDTLPADWLKPDDRLLLAHPHALPPEALVEIDRFVRAGGRAVVLADGLSGWPPPHRFGDPRNPPVTSLLTPLLDHWGITLVAPVPGQAAAETAHVRHGGYRLTLHSAGHFAGLPQTCRGAGDNGGGQSVIAICRIGEGTVTLLADADLLYAPLWQSAPSWARHLRPSDNIEWVAQAVNEPRRYDIWGLRPTRLN